MEAEDAGAALSRERLFRKTKSNPGTSEPYINAIQLLLADVYRLAALCRTNGQRCICISLPKGRFVLRFLIRCYAAHTAAVYPLKAAAPHMRLQDTEWTQSHALLLGQIATFWTIFLVKLSKSYIFVLLANVSSCNIARDNEFLRFH